MTSTRAEETPDYVGELRWALRRRIPRAFLPSAALAAITLAGAAASGFAVQTILLLAVVGGFAAFSGFIALSRFRRTVALAEALRPRIVEAAPPGTRRVILVLDSGLVVRPFPDRLLFWMLFAKDGTPIQPQIVDLLRWTRTMRMTRIGAVLRKHGPPEAQERIARIGRAIGASRAHAVFFRNRDASGSGPEPAWSAMGIFVRMSPRAADPLPQSIDEIGGYLEATLRTFRESLPSFYGGFGPAARTT